MAANPDIARNISRCCSSPASGGAHGRLDRGERPGRAAGGITEGETAEALGVTTRTVQREWGKARMLLRRARSS